MDTVNKIRKIYKQTGTVNTAATKVQCSWATAKNLIEASPDELLKRGKRNRKSVLITPEVVSSIENIFHEESEKKVHRKQRYKRFNRNWCGENFS
jgi:hypothetical protein